MHVLLDPQHHKKLGMTVYAYNPSTLEVRIRASSIPAWATWAPVWKKMKKNKEKALIICGKITNHFFSTQLLLEWDVPNITFSQENPACQLVSLSRRWQWPQLDKESNPSLLFYYPISYTLYLHQKTKYWGFCQEEVWRKKGITQHFRTWNPNFSLFYFH